MSNATEAMARRRTPSIRVWGAVGRARHAVVLVAGATAANAQPKDHRSVPITVSANGDPLQASPDVTPIRSRTASRRHCATLIATVTDAATGAVTNINQPVALPVDLQQAEASCEILELVLAPLDLNPIGLEVHLDQVHLNRTSTVRACRSQKGPLARPDWPAPPTIDSSHNQTSWQI